MCLHPPNPFLSLRITCHDLDCRKIRVPCHHHGLHMRVDLLPPQPAGYLVGQVSKVQRHNSGEFAQIDVTPAAQLAGGHHVVVLFSDSLAMEQPHVNR